MIFEIAILYHQKTILLSFVVIVAKGAFASLTDARTALVGTKFIYKLATPIISPLTYTAVKQYYPQTNIYTNATVQPTLEGKFRVIGT